MKALIINNHSKSVSDIRKIVEAQGIQTETVKHFDFVLEKLNDFDFYILTGGKGHQVAGNSQKFSEEINLLKTSNKAILGICLGFELICLTFNSQLQRKNMKISSSMNITALQPDHPLFRGIEDPTKIKVRESHRWVVKTIPDEFEALATSRYGYEIVKHKEKSIYGFQFHPELSTKTTQGKLILENFINLAIVS